MKWIIATCLFVFASCSVLSSPQRERVRAQIQQEYQDGNITAAQRDAAIEALDKDEPFDWEALGLVGLNLMLALVGGPLVVRKMRGPPTQRVGLPADKVIQP